MNLGQIDKENQKLIDSYKSYGFATKTDLVNQALHLLQQSLAEKRRERLLKKAAAGYAKSDAKPVWEDLDGEDFVL